MFDDLDPKEFEDTARTVVEGCADLADASARAAMLGEAGLIGVSAPESVGGLALPLDFAVPVVAAAGAGLLGFPLIESMVLAKALAGVNDALAGEIAAGETVATIAWVGVAEDGVVGGAPMAAEAARVLVFRADGSAVLAPLGNGVTAEVTAPLDVDAPEARITLNGPVEGIVLSAEVVATLRADATLLRTGFVRGSAERCLSLAADYAQDRSQFGKPLSANQVIRHRLSRDRLAIETMRCGLTRALGPVPGGDAALARDTAWLSSAKAGIAVAESAIQVFGGMGFTWEVPLHRHLRQMRAQASYGAAAEGTEALGARVLAGRDNDWYGEIAHVV
ncbi:acyl-CoA dehydrogenase [Mesobacterium pallidum]|uniref:acyl-CoA dehydrogenase n=1 Tax=Mesobacterium pallidum TaxID=2872037 RepID=UPI001EE302BB|nr:acyl-CoA dehydrogenase [Mesobacterium pallidum]